MNGALHHEVNGEGPPLVLVHGSWVDATGWRQLVALLAPEHRILTFDRRGHSRSAGAGGGTLDDDVDDLASLIESLDLAPAHVVGNAPHRTHPEQYAALLRDFTAQVG